MSSVPPKKSWRDFALNVADKPTSFRAKAEDVHPANIVYLWWDFENIEIEEDQVVHLTKRIVACLRSIDDSLRLAKTMYGMGNITSSFIKKYGNAFRAMGFILKGTPKHTLTCPKCRLKDPNVGPFLKSEKYITKRYERVKEIADCMIVQGVIGHVCENTGSKNIAFITGDGGFSVPMNSLRTHGYKVFLFQKEDSKEALKVSASYTWELQRIFQAVDNTRTIYRHPR